MPDIADYTDYRCFLKAFYEDAKAKAPFTYQRFSDLAGIKSKGYLHNVMKGSRKLDTSCVLGLAKAMKLDKHETEYLECLVGMDNARTLDERNHFHERLRAIRSKGRKAWQPQILRNDQYDYFAKQHYTVVRGILGLAPFKEDYALLGRNLRPRLTLSQARDAVHLLLRLGLVRRTELGVVELVDKTIATPREVSSLAVQNYHRQAGELAMKALNDLPSDKRNFASMTLGISSRGYKMVVDEMLQLRRRLLKMAEADEGADRVYQLNLQLFPVSRTPIERSAQ